MQLRPLDALDVCPQRAAPAGRGAPAIVALLLAGCGASGVSDPIDAGGDFSASAERDSAAPTHAPAWVADVASGAPIHTDALAPDATGVDDGLDDAPLLQARLDAAAPGSVVRLAAGTYTLARTLRLPPGVVLAGQGVDRTVLARAPDAWEAFGYGYLVAPAADPTAESPPTGVRNLTVDGMRRSGDGAPNQGGGVKAADHWIVEDLAFRDFNYFRLWLKDTDGVRVRRCTFDDGAAPTSSDNDNIGGGGNADLLLEDIVIAANTVGNAIDLLNSERLVIRGLHAAPGAVHLQHRLRHLRRRLHRARHRRGGRPHGEHLRRHPGPTDHAPGNRDRRKGRPRDRARHLDRGQRRDRTGFPRAVSARPEREGPPPPHRVGTPRRTATRPRGGAPRRRRAEEVPFAREGVAGAGPSSEAPAHVPRFASFTTW